MNNDGIGLKEKTPYFGTSFLLILFLNHYLWLVNRVRSVLLFSFFFFVFRAQLVRKDHILDKRDPKIIITL